MYCFKFGYIILIILAINLSFSLKINMMSKKQPGNKSNNLKDQLKPSDFQPKYMINAPVS